MLGSNSLSAIPAPSVDTPPPRPIWASRQRSIPIRATVACSPACRSKAYGWEWTTRRISPTTTLARTPLRKFCRTPTFRRRRTRGVSLKCLRPRHPQSTSQAAARQRHNRVPDQRPKLAKLAKHEPTASMTRRPLVAKPSSDQPPPPYGGPESPDDGPLFYAVAVGSISLRQSDHVLKHGFS